MIELMIVVAILGILAAPARAIFMRAQMAPIDAEPLFDRYYFVSLLGFSYPEEWKRLWEASADGNAYRVNAASLDCCQLYIEQELRFQKKMTEGLVFKFNFVELEDKERQELHHWLEFEQALGRGFAASIFGEPTFQKGDSDVGFGLGYRQGRLKAQARHVFVDFDFNRRSGTTQNDAVKPQTDQFAVDLGGAGWNFWTWLEIDHPLRRAVPDENRFFTYRRMQLRTGFRRDGPFRRRLEYSYEFQRKGNAFAPDPGGAAVDSLRQTHRWLLAGEADLTPVDSLEFGHVQLSRSARSDFAGAADAGKFYRRWEAQPYARWRRSVNARVTTDLGAFFSFGENRRRFAGGRTLLADRLVEAKLGAGVDFIFGSKGRVGIYTSFALDRPTSPWGGGNLRALIFF